MISPAHYKHVSRLTEGGVGRVELALRREGNFERLYAIKRLHRRFADDEDFRSMFVDEAKLAGMIRHPNVVAVLDVGQDEDGPFLAMEYVEGLALSAVIRSLDAPAPVQVALRIVTQAARGLNAAHELRGYDGAALQVVHRDVSPQNILVSFDGNVLVTDFGIAKALGRSTRTGTGILKGKFGYMSPEQLRFEKVDRRADLFSLGIVLYELLAGKRLYQNKDDHDGLHRILHEPPPDVGLVRHDIPDEVVRLVFELLAKDPAKRPSTAEDVAGRLEDATLELAADEGTFEVRDFMRDQFSGIRKARAADLEEALRLASQPSIHPEEISALDGHPHRQRRALGARITGAIAGAILTAGVGAGAWYGLRPNGRGPTSSSIGDRPSESTTRTENRATEIARPSIARTPAVDSTAAAPTPLELATTVAEVEPGVSEAPTMETLDAPPRTEPPRARRLRQSPRRRTRRAAQRHSAPAQPVPTAEPTPSPPAEAPTMDNPPRSAIPSLGWDER